MRRIQESYILKDLDKKIVLLVGPRQAGKTWLAKEVAKKFKKTLYLNYDSIPDRLTMQEQAWLPEVELLILDELHKMPQWKNYLKGVFDTRPEGMRILVTGSARLDVYDQIGDSLAGRYYRHRLLPFSISELSQISDMGSIDRILTRSGFPEPFLAESSLEAERWRQQYIHSILSNDVFDIDRIDNLKSFRLLFELLRHRVGSQISYRSIAEDLQISPHTVKKYIEILQSLYIIFTVTPYKTNIARSILKEPKIYFYDSGLVAGNDGARLENLVAVSLLKNIYAENDYHAKNFKLHYLRTKEKIEVDFALVDNEEVKEIIEVKSTKSSIHQGLKYFNNKYGFVSRQLVASLRTEKTIDNIQILNLQEYLSNLFM